MRAWRVLAPLVVAALLAAACGADGGPSGRGGEATGPAAAPSRIVSLSPTATETLLAIGAGDRVAVDDQSDHPATAPRTRLSGHRPSAEAVVAHRPDLVVVAGRGLPLLPAEALVGERPPPDGTPPLGSAKDQIPRI